MNNKQFTASFNMDNAAFDENPREEVSRIMVEIIHCVKDGSDQGSIRDINGNVIGFWIIES